MNYSIARVEQYSANQIGKAERHNERKNEVYSNMNVETFRSDMNYHFADCGEQTYLERLKEIEEQGLVSKRGLREDAKIFDEMIIDVKFKKTMRIKNNLFEFISEKNSEDSGILSLFKALAKEAFKRLKAQIVSKKTKFSAKCIIMQNS